MVVCRYVCLGSHRRFRTPEERQALVHQEPTPVDYRSMPTCCRIKLRQGQTCFFTGTAIHRGFKESVGAPARLSLSWGLQSLDAPHEPGARFAGVR